MLAWRCGEQRGRAVLPSLGPQCSSSGGGHTSGWREAVRMPSCPCTPASAVLGFRGAMRGPECSSPSDCPGSPGRGGACALSALGSISLLPGPGRTWGPSCRLRTPSPALGFLGLKCQPSPPSLAPALPWGDSEVRSEGQACPL